MENSYANAWYNPEIQVAAYDHFITLVSGFLKDNCPIDKITSFAIYLVVYGFKGPSMIHGK